MRASFLARIWFVLTFALLHVVASERSAEAYPWMIRHEYTQCVSCHVDPAGGGLLSNYGRAQGELLLRTRYDSGPPRGSAQLGEPLLGVVTLPESLNLGADVRFANLQRALIGRPPEGRFLLMQADALGELTVGRFRVNGSIGVVDEGGNAAAITAGAEEKVVSRTHWVGLDLGANREFLVRAGRLNLPFGLRSVEHTRLVRSETRTDTNTAQQHGVSIDYARKRLRGGLMAILGNFAIGPDKFRSRGFAAYGEWAIRDDLAVGLSSMATHAEFDIALLTPTWRHAHGAFARYSPFRAMVVSGEVDFLHTSQPTPGRTAFGGVGLLSADLEPIQGLHLGPTFELLARDFDGPASYGGWASAWWFFLPHMDVRVDAITHSLASERGRIQMLSGLVQVHGYL